MSRHLMFGIGGVIIGLILLAVLPWWVPVLIIVAAIAIPVIAWRTLDSSSGAGSAECAAGASSAGKPPTNAYRPNGVTRQLHEPTRSPKLTRFPIKPGSDGPGRPARLRRPGSA